MIGLNGALLGQRRQTNVIEGPGVWTLKEHAVRRKSNLWPYGPTDGDPYFSFVQALHFFNGSFSDSSMYNNAISGYDNPTISTSVVRHGSGSMNTFIGSPGQQGGYIYWTAPAPLGANDYTIEGWVRPNSAYASGDSPMIMELRVGGSDAGTFYIYGDGSPTPTIRLRVVVKTSGGSSFQTVVSSSSSTEIYYDQWTHFAVVRKNYTYKLFLNGVDSGTGSTFVFDHNGSQVFHFGRAASGSNIFRGYFDTIRVTNGVARYESNFTPPADAFPAF